MEKSLGKVSVLIFLRTILIGLISAFLAVGVTIAQEQQRSDLGSNIEDSSSLPSPKNSEAGTDPAEIIEATLRRIPTEPWFYQSILLLIIAYLVWRLVMLNIKLEHHAQEIKDADRRLTDRDFRVIKGFRIRALFLLMRADIILIFTFLLLISSVYLIIYVLPEIRERDFELVDQAQEERIKRDISNSLQAIADGRYWLKIPDQISNNNKDALDKIVKTSQFWSVRNAQELSTHVITNSKTGWASENLELDRGVKITATDFSDDVKVGIVATDAGSLFMVRDSDGEWKPQSLDYADDFFIEGISRAVLSADGKTSVVVEGVLGNVFTKTHDNDSWRRAPNIFGLNSIDSVKGSADSKTILALDTDDNIYMTTNSGESWTNVPSDIGLTNRIVEGGFSVSNSIFSLVTSQGSVIKIMGGGKNEPDTKSLKLKSGERVEQAAFSADGNIGIVLGDKGSVFMRKEAKEPFIDASDVFKLNNGEIATEAMFSTNGSTGIVAGSGGSVYTYMPQNGSNEWKLNSLNPQRGESIAETTVSSDGRTIVVLGDSGSIFVTTDYGIKWEREIIASALGKGILVRAVGNTYLVVTDKGAAVMTIDGGKNWNTEELYLKLQNQTDAKRVGLGGSISIIASRRGSEFTVITKNGGKDWSGKSLGGNVIAVTVSDDGMTATAYNIANRVFTKHSHDDDNWIKTDLILELQEDIVDSALTRRNTGIVASNKGHLYIKTDVRKEWEKKIVPEGQRIDVVAFNPNTKTSIFASDRGPIFISTDEGNSWRLTEVEDLGRNRHIVSVGVLRFTDNPDLGRFFSSSSGASSNEIFVGESDDEVLFYLPGPYPEFNSWNSMSLIDLRKEMEKFDTLSNSKILEKITTTVPSQQDESNGSGNNFIDDFLDDLMVMRAVTLTILFFLVQILVRLYQYSLRLAAFWESRADALLLSGSFATYKAKRFDDLVAALAPDAYDFKSAPKAPLDWLSLRKQS